MRKIALVGTEMESGCQAPFDDESWEIWGVGSKFEYVTRATRWYEVHRLDGEPEDWAAGWRKLIRKFSKDVDLYMMYPEPDLGPRVIPYPVDEIAGRFGTYFMTSSFSWMTAQAIHELCPESGKKKKGMIGIWGVNMEYGTEYREQRNGFRHFLALARFAGIETQLHVTGGLLYEPTPYPMWQDDPLRNKIDTRMVKTRKALDDKDDLRQRTILLLSENRGRRAEATDEARIASLDKEARALNETLRGLDSEIAAGRGAFEEQAWLRDYLTP